MEQVALRKKIIDAGIRLVNEHLVTRSWGNISVRVNDDEMLITPSGRTYESLKPEEIVLMNYHTFDYEGKIQPSSEFYLHAFVYQQRKEINAVIHTHQMNATTVAVARREVPPIIDDMVQIIGPSVRVSKYTIAGTKKFARNAVKALKGRQAALLANHGAVCVGRDLDEAFIVAEVLEKACKAFIEAEFLGGSHAISRVTAKLMHEVYLRKYSRLKDKNKLS
ncbi:class II aldolase/adducin family protein [Candidatus Sulfidibacterium hydrothermale]|uniref:class II aldolase/adducin family protein n=1 Tax=Candidatus Sulfidibacterium hydrothermale TaxID=2875962 RepID=UPI001F0B1E5A|nr:class II aldolase/adducin family protein [Candidatus Sulfidibacterium hydrothermale]UBM62218.1 class II aldolase/adducin family protein [Candidatus Sulfidibacterium hydrothermale]